MIAQRESLSETHIIFAIVLAIFTGLTMALPPYGTIVPVVLFPILWGSIVTLGIYQLLLKTGFISGGKSVAVSGELFAGFLIYILSNVISIAIALSYSLPAGELFPLHDLLLGSLIAHSMIFGVIWDIWPLLLVGPILAVILIYSKQMGL
jgi:hypothetical protein